MTSMIGLGMMCRCGRIITSTAGLTASAETYDENGRCIYAVCSHGAVVIDERPVPEDGGGTVTPFTTFAVCGRGWR